MPIYQYSCVFCYAKFEFFRQMSDRNEIVSCPNCAKTLRREVERNTFILKGSNWGRDNYNGKTQR